MGGIFFRHFFWNISEQLFWKTLGKATSVRFECLVRRVKLQGAWTYYTCDGAFCFFMYDWVLNTALWYYFEKWPSGILSAKAWKKLSLKSFNKISRDCINWQRPARYSRTFYEFSLEKKLEAQASSSGFYIIPSNSVLMLTFPALQISGNCIKRKINLNFYFHTFTIPKAFIKPFVAPQRSEKKNLS